MPNFFNLLPWRRKRMDRELDRELQDHLQRRIDELIEGGASNAEARRQAALEFGGIAQAREDARETWMYRWADNLGRDLRYAARTLSRSKGFSITALVSLALGIGANAAVFSIADQVLLQRLAVREPDRLVLLDWMGTSLTSSWGNQQMSYPLCRYLESQTSLFDGVFCRYPTDVNFSTGQQHVGVRAEIVSGSYFQVLGVAAEQGRLIEPHDDLQPGMSPVAVISHGYWANALGSRGDIVGLKVLVNNFPLTVIGVAPASFKGIDPLAAPAVWIPTMMTRQAGGSTDPMAAGSGTPWDRLFDRRAAWLNVFARLKPAITADQAEAHLQPWFKSMLEEDMRRAGFPAVSADQRQRFLASTIEVEPAPRGFSNARLFLRQPLFVLMAGAVLLLLLACLNVAGLLLARGAARSRELTTRLALGASRQRLSGQLLVESTMIALVGGALGLALAPAASRSLIAFLAPDGSLIADVSGRGVLFALAASVLTAALCGIVPALRTGRLSLVTALKERAASASLGGVRLRKALLVSQMALTLLLLVGAGLFVQTLSRLYAKGPGFVTSRVAMFRIDPLAIGYSEADGEQLMRDVLRELRAIPGVERVAVANSSLMNGGWSTTTLTIQGNERLTTDREVPRMRVSPGFFATVGAPVIAGRDFDEHDVRAPGAMPTPYRSAIVNQSFARRYFDGRSPVGARLGLGTRPDAAANIDIIGVVRDFSARDLRDDNRERVFFQFWDQNSGDGTFYLKMRGDTDATFGSIRSAVARFDPALPVLGLTTVDEQIDRSLRTERMLAALSSAFGGIALLLSVVGLYGLMSFVVTRRTHEIGLRLALGATRGNAMWLIVREALIVIATAAIIALPGVWALGRLLEAQLFGVRPLDAPTMSLACALLTVVALSAAMLPAWRAASVNPTESLRAE